MRCAGTFPAILFLLTASALACAESNAVTLRFPAPGLRGGAPAPAWRWNRAYQLYEPEPPARSCFIVLLRNPDSPLIDAWVRCEGRPPFARHADDMHARVNPDGTLTFIPDAGNPGWKTLRPGSVFRGERRPRYEERTPAGSAGDVRMAEQKDSAGTGLYLRRAADTGHTDDLPITEKTECAYLLLPPGETAKIQDFRFRPAKEFLSPDAGSAER